MGFFSWIIFGALAGWAANVVVGGKDRRGGCLFSVVVGVVGAALGGLIYRLVTGKDKTYDFDFPSFGVAVLGAIVLLGLMRLALEIGHRKGSSRDRS
jgi:uncharacterized membrane protein YeaQ/YmgE (transglycosylase-associated protein family)